jgi:3-hydroxyisobutyrate dehydrogenase-like beta-hydroxyacid dehydrogenase
VNSGNDALVTPAPKRAGFVGLGLMGAPMAGGPDEDFQRALPALEALDSNWHI